MAWPAVIGAIGNIVGGWFDHKKAKTEAKRQVELQRITADADVDKAAASDMSTSWKDEYLTILFSVPLVVVFYAAVWGETCPPIDQDPTGQCVDDIQRVKTAFQAMQELPDWYMYSVIGIVIGTFGLRGLAKLINK